ncbi:prephenate dehydrogenase [Crocosphaera subtropica ATCC 51142]|uniref:Prephenate dehydrogenase n=1 Tax=Crocosphaera subtropica (strain ATCC 51142 / BH68) TaxID=43989 RepID=B1WUF7_CROS5|nr:prephenate/arogenate dehydrogenase [Crocosphaera subtropica]ACB53811.1 prephenate dehydrogenase [Crocosphaera subtropica ATCC 51142]
MKIGIIGLGLIGGSLGFDLRNCGHIIYGVSRKESTCQRAIEREVVDHASININSLSTVDLIFICTPITLISSTLKQLTSNLRPEVIITDVGSVKTAIVKECEPLWSNFVGGHPMAGTAEQGIEAAQKNLFKAAPYVITPTENTPKNSIKILEQLAQSLGSKVYTCSPEIHDQAVAWISHLPVMVSASLIAACVGEKEKTVLNLAQQLASSGFKDTSRVGGGNPELGLMMAQYNKTGLLHSLQGYRQQLDEVIEYINREEWDSLEQLLMMTQKKRPPFIGGQKNS